MKPTLSDTAKRCLQIWLDTANELTLASLEALAAPGGSLSQAIVAKAEQLGRASAAAGLPTPSRMHACQPLYELTERSRLAAVAA